MGKAIFLEFVKNFLLVKNIKRIACQLRYQIQYIEFVFLTVDSLVSKKENKIILNMERNTRSTSICFNYIY